MSALIMCGGKGTRLGGEVEKPLVEVCGDPMVDRVAAALAASDAGPVYAVASPHAPETAAHVAAAESVTVLSAPGDGYVADLAYALDRVDGPALTVAADLPLLPPDAVNRTLAAVDGGDASLTVCVPAALKRRLGASVDATFDHEGRTLAPTGLNVADEGDDEVFVSDDARLAVNVNRASDLALANALCRP